MQSPSQTPTDIFGKITPPVIIDNDPFVGLGKLLAFLVRFFLIVAGLIAGTYLLLGAFDWITSAGEKEKLAKKLYRNECTKENFSCGDRQDGCRFRA